MTESMDRSFENSTLEQFDWLLNSVQVPQTYPSPRKWTSDKFPFAQ